MDSRSWSWVRGRVDVRREVRRRISSIRSGGRGRVGCFSGGLVFGFVVVVVEDDVVGERGRLRSAASRRRDFAAWIRDSFSF